MKGGVRDRNLCPLEKPVTGVGIDKEDDARPWEKRRRIRHEGGGLFKNTIGNYRIYPLAP